MKVYLDDEREESQGWTRAYTAQEAVDFLRTGRVTAISLDHDLGDNKNGTGYDVICWIEQRVEEGPDFKVPLIFLHTANPVGEKRMRQVLSRILSIQLGRV